MESTEIAQALEWHASPPAGRRRRPLRALRLNARQWRLVHLEDSASGMARALNAAFVTAYNQGRSRQGLRDHVESVMNQHLGDQPLSDEPRAVLYGLVDYLFGAETPAAPMPVSLRIGRDDLYTLRVALAALADRTNGGTGSIGLDPEPLRERLDRLAAEVNPIQDRAPRRVA